MPSKSSVAVTASKNNLVIAKEFIASVATGVSEYPLPDIYVRISSVIDNELPNGRCNPTAVIS